MKKLLLIIFSLTLFAQEVQAPKPNPEKVNEVLRIRLRMSNLVQQFEGLRKAENQKVDELSTTAPEGYILDRDELVFVKTEKK